MKNCKIMLVFFTGLFGMIWEVAATRLFIPYFGDNTIIFSSVISVFMAGIALGYWRGGVLADKEKTTKQLSRYMTIAAVLSFFLLFVHPILFLVIKAGIKNIYLQVLLSCLIFLPGSTVAGMVMPYIIKKAVKKKEIIASSVGKIAALSTVGSIVGTLAAGFWIIPNIGTTTILYSIPIFLLIIGIIINHDRFLFTRLIVIAVIIRVAILPMDKTMSIILGVDIVDVIDTKYSKYLVYEREYNDKKTIIYTNDPQNAQSIKYVNDNNPVEGFYIDWFSLYKYFHKDPVANVLMLGAGGMVFPEFFAKNHSDSHIDVVEIDSAVIEIAKKHFRYKNPGNIDISISDARNYIENHTGNKYDLVFMDVFGSNATIPFHLTTKEYFEKLAYIMKDNGTLVFNVVTMKDNRLIEALLTTMSHSFGNCYAFPVEQVNPKMKTQNVILVAEKQKKRKSIHITGEPKLDKILKTYNQTLYKQGMELTDNFAPVKYLINYGS